MNPGPVLPSQVSLCAGRGTGLPAQHPALPSRSSTASPGRSHRAADSKRHLRTQNAAVEAWSRVAVIFQQNDFFSRSDTYTPPPDSLETGARSAAAESSAHSARCSPPASLQDCLCRARATADHGFSPLPAPGRCSSSHREQFNLHTFRVSSWIFKLQIFPVLKTRLAARRGLLAAHPSLLLPQHTLPFFSTLYR